MRKSRGVVYCLGLVAVILGLSCQSAPQATTADGAMGPELRAVYGEGMAVQGVEVSPDGRWMAFSAGDEGSRQIFLLDRQTGENRPVGEMAGDNRDVNWMPDGRRLIFSSNRAGSYDLYTMDLNGGAVQQITDLDGDALQPTVSPVQYGFFVVFDYGCGEGPEGRRIDVYEKVVFTLRDPSTGRKEVWFSSIKPADFELGEREQSVELSEHGAHSGRLSEEGKSCEEPVFSGDGLSLVYACDFDGAVVMEAPGAWDQSFSDAVEALGLGEIPECQDQYRRDSSYDWQTCLEKLPRRYTRHEGEVISEPGHARPAYSANQTLVIADDGRSIVARHRFWGDGQWREVVSGDEAVRGGRWLPDGSGVVYLADDGIEEVQTDFYLQEVRNLHEFPELFGEGQSLKLAENRFVVRPGEAREFYALYEQLRYERRPQFVTADATLQVFRDEFVRLLEDAEEQAAQRLLDLTDALAWDLWARYEGSGDPSDRYLALYFQVPRLYLQAAVDLLADQEPHDYWGPPPSEAILEEMPDAVRDLLGSVPEPLRQEAEKLVELSLAHQGLGEVEVPTFERPVTVDWSQFQVRGNYAEGGLAGYFLAMIWYAQMPLPMDETLIELMGALERLQVGEQGGMEAWSTIDALVGSFMGKPVDATLGHLREVMQEQPEIFKPLDMEALQEALEERRGEIRIRDATALVSGDGTRSVKMTFFPQRQGLDTTFFRELTHPEVELRPFPSALDAMAVLGSERARENALQAASDEAWAADYRSALEELLGKEEQRDDAYFSTDIYHSWLAVLVMLARAQGIDDAPVVDFVASDAWGDRLLSSALGGYTHLKHSAVLYNAQDFSAECGGEPVYYGLVEQPELPTPRGYIDPMPEFFRGLADLSDRVYRDLSSDSQGPAIPWRWWDDPINVRDFAADLAAVSERQFIGEVLSEEDYEFIEFVGARMEALTLGFGAGDSIQIQGEGRTKRGVVLATDIHTNAMRGEVLQLGVGLVDEIFVSVPDEVGRRMTQGGIFSFYEFAHPMEDRLTDDAWDELLSGDEALARPGWTESFFEER